MTISSENRVAGPYIGNDAATAFPFAFKVFGASDLQVVLTDSAGVESTLTLTSDYTVALNSNQDSNPGGTVTLPDVLATGTKLTITSNIAPLQATDLTNQGGFYPKVITNALDKLTILIQQIFNGLNRSIKLPISNSDDGTLPAGDRANTVVGFDALGKLKLLALQTGTSLVDLAASAGASLIGFVQSGSGAVERTVEGKLREWVSVNDFGAVGDGVTDDTAAMNAAAAAAGAAKKALFVSAGVYKMTAPWVVPIKVYVLGESLAIQDAYDPANAWQYGAIIFKAHTGNGITKTGAGPYDEGAPIENITISSHRTNFPGGNGFVLDQCSNVHLIRCNVFGVGGDCYVMGVTAGDVTGHNYVYSCYSNNPVGVHYRVRQKWGRFHYPVADGGTHGMYLDNAPETHVDGFHFEGYTVAAVRCVNANQSSRFVGKGFVGNTANALYGFILDNAVGNNNITIENVKFQGPSGLANSVGVSIGANAINTRIQGCEFNQWATAIDNNASYLTTKSWVLDSTFYANELGIRSNAGNSEYRGNQFDATTGSFDISHVGGSNGLWTGNVFGKSINPGVTGVQGNFSDIRVKENVGYVSRNRGTTGSITAYTNIAHGLAGVPNHQIVLTCNSSGITSFPQVASLNATNFSLYWTGTENVQWNWEAALPCDY